MTAQTSGGPLLRTISTLHADSDRDVEFNPPSSPYKDLTEGAIGRFDQAMPFALSVMLSCLPAGIALAGLF